MSDHAQMPCAGTCVIHMCATYQHMLHMMHVLPGDRGGDGDDRREKSICSCAGPAPAGPDLRLLPLVRSVDAGLICVHVMYM